MIDKEQVQDDLQEMWAGDWRANHLEKIHATGASTIAEFLAQYPAMPFHKILREQRLLIAPAQLKTLQFEEARLRGDILQAAKDLLVRTLNEVTKRGWGQGGHWETNRASAYSHFINDLAMHSGDPALKEIAQNIWHALEELNPPLGWLPVCADDPLIQKSFEIGWPNK